MRIQLLGTAAAEGQPAMFCGCDVCLEARKRGGKDVRSRSGALIDDVLKIDLSPDTLYHIHRDKLNPVLWRHLLFTHGHEDHCAPYELIYLLPPFSVTDKSDMEIFGPSTVIDRIRDAVGQHAQLRLKSLEPYQTTTLGAYQVTPILATHDDRQVCMNHIINDGSHRLLYATDTGWYGEETWRFLEGCGLDLLIIEGTNGFVHSDYVGHLGLDGVIRARQRLLDTGGLKVGARTITTHFSHNGRPFHADLEAALNPHGIEPAYDGMVIQV